MKNFYLTIPCQGKDTVDAFVQARDVAEVSGVIVQIHEAGSRKMVGRVSPEGEVLLNNTGDDVGSGITRPGKKKKEPKYTPKQKKEKKPKNPVNKTKAKKK